GAELHLITLTAGQAGENPDSHDDLASVRLKEWREAGKKIGATGMHHLGFVDGELGNDAMIRATQQITQIVRDTVAAHKSATEVELMTMDTNGISGHIDHIVASRAAHYVFYLLKQEGLPMRHLKLVCIPRVQTGDEPNLDFVFMEPGRRADEIDQVVDNQDLVGEVYDIMRTHHTQRGDCEQHIRQLGDEVAIDHFIVRH
ncbi:hypothetical protein B7Z17_01560, partial [Candidatus Saccharibacteria bacterium 32-49-10]